MMAWIHTQERQFVDVLREHVDALLAQMQTPEPEATGEGEGDGFPPMPRGMRSAYMRRWKRPS